MSDVWTVQRVLAWAVQDFRSKRFESPRLEAELLVGRATGLDRVQLIAHGDRPVSADELACIREFIQRRRRAEPSAYILGEREFYGLTFRVDARVLIPRPDTETLVDVALERTRHHSEYGEALDLCTGSGCVAIAFKHQRPTWQVTATDVSGEALDVARANAERLGTVFGMAFQRSDLFAGLSPGRRFELITANPPYIPRAELAKLQPDVREFEPELALVGGDDGLDIVRRLVEQAPEHLEPGGVLALEMGYDQGEATSALFRAASFEQVTTTKDYGTRDRVVSGRLRATP
jgi:release factor glutamine methyltransferase